MGGNSLKEWKNQGKQHFFLWITHKIPSLSYKTRWFDADIIWEKSEENKLQRKKWKQKNKKEKEREEKRRRDFGAFLSHTCMCTRIPTAILFFCCHKCHTMGENSIEKWENSGKSKKKQRGKMCFFLWFRVLFGRLSHPLVKFPSATTHNNIENNDLTRSLWHLWQQKDKTPCQCARTRAREKVCL